MSKNTISRKLKFPGMPEAKYRLHHGRIIAADKAAKVTVFKKVADAGINRPI